jgi:dipeptidyl aminopeptidase/acylaminoacyl peptidase
MGWSYGGYMTMWMQGHTTRFKCIASMMGRVRLRAAYGATEELWFPSTTSRARPGRRPSTALVAEPFVETSRRPRW